MNHLLDDLRFGLRMLLKTPATTISALLALSLGIGVSAWIFSMIDGAILTELPVEGGDRIMRVGRFDPLTTGTTADYPAWLARQRSFESFGAVVMSTVTLGIEGWSTEPVMSAAISTHVLPLLSVEPALGRPFADQDAVPGAPAVVLVSHDVWRDRLGSDAGALGQMVRLNGRPAQIVGVMPEGFGFPWDQDVWSPLPVSGSGSVLSGSSEEAAVIGRLHEGVTADEAAEELTAIARELDPPRIGDSPEDSEVAVTPYTDLFGDSRGALLSALMLGIAFMVLLVACATSRTCCSHARAPEAGKSPSASRSARRVTASLPSF
jgi:putative ABC transport system permease protein